METIKEGYTRVSTILAQWNHLAHINPDVLANKCRIGTNVHAKIEAETVGIYLDLKEDEKGYFDSWKKWWDKESFKNSPSDIEQRFYCDKLMITGCVDAIVTGEKGGLILDYKTSASSNKKMWALQATFYHYLVGITGEQLEDKVWFLHLKKDGKIGKIREFEINDELWETCLAALNTYRYFNA